MDTNENLIDNFANILKNHHTTPSFTLYGPNQSRNNHVQEYEIKDVIKDVAKQLKAIQKADRTRMCTREKTTSNLPKKTNFLPLNKVPIEQCSKPIQLNKFETQCVLDTQLINIIEDAEAIIDAEKGITQEFDTTFCHKDLDNSNDNIQEKDCFIESDHVNIAVIKTLNTNDGQDYCSVNKPASIEEKSIADLPFTNKMSRNIVSRIGLENKNDKNVYTQEDDENKYIDLSEEPSNTLKTKVEEPKSPILSRLQPKVKSNTPSPLIFRLESFEKFETIAMPVIRENHDIETTKRVINSQIMNRELFIQTHAEPVLSDRDKELSPILKIHKNCNPENLVTSTNSKPKFFEEDCLLFSSDEEYDVQELPLTCPIQTSFCIEPDILDKTMYVGFQTASNKPIQIQTDSYNKAVTIFDNVSKIHEEDNYSTNTNSSDCVHVSKNKAIIQCNTDKYVDDCFKTVSDEPLNKAQESNILCDNNNTISNNIESYNNFKNQSPSDETHLQLYDCHISNDINLPEDEDREKKSNKSLADADKFETIAVNNKSSKKIDDIVNNKNCADNSTEYFKIDHHLLEEFNTDLMYDKSVQKSYKIDNTNVYTLNTKIISKDINVAFNKIDFNSLSKNFKSTNDEKIKMADQALVRKEKDLNTFIHDEMTEKCEINLQSDNLLDVNQPTNNNFVGFNTANNKRIKVSAQALMKTKNIFDNIDNDESFPRKLEKRKIENLQSLNKTKSSKLLDLNADKHSITHNSKLQTFKTASNQRIEVSKEALANSRTIFQDIVTIKDIINYENDDFKETSTSPGYNTVSSYIFQGFKTGSNKTVQVSESALINAKSIFKNISIEDAKTASNKPVQISESTIASVKCVFNDIDTEENKTVHDDFNNIRIGPACETAPNSIFQGFKTANNKPVKITESALTNAKSIFQDLAIEENETVHNDFNNIKLRPACEIVSNSVFQGFKTANNKPVKISDSALTNAKSVFQDIALEDNKTAHNGFSDIKMRPACETASNPVFQGFKTANNKPLKISESALTNAKSVFQDLAIEDNRIVHNDFNDIKIRPACNADFNTGFQGFKTANNKSVKISESALTKVKSIFQDIDIEENFNDQPVKIFENHLSKTTDIVHDMEDTNVPIKISKEAFSKAKSIFQDIEVDDHTLNKIKNSFGIELNDKQPHSLFGSSKHVTCRGFKTAGDKPVAISAEALAKSNKLFQDMDIDCERKISDAEITETQIELTPNGRRIFKELNLGNSDKRKALEKADMSNKKLDQYIELNLNNNFKTPSCVDDHIIKGAIGNNSLRKFSFNTANNKPVNVSEEALEKSRNLFSELNKAMKAENADGITSGNQNLEESFNTEIIKDFEETVYTEDFIKDETPKNKRSGSPILLCPNAKRRKKFETPVTIKKFTAPGNTEKAVQLTNTYTFKENYKKNKKYSLKDVNEIEKLKNTNDIDSYIFIFQYETLLDFEFFGVRNDIDNDTWTIDKVKRYFTDSVNMKIIPEGWMENHLKLIIWKLISYEIRFPQIMKNVCTVRNVLEQLKYRYDRELYNVERPALRKILEKDVASTRRMVLCVASMFVDGVSVSSVTNQAQNIELLLSDGWYTIKASTDRMIDKLVCDGKISIGTKLVVHGAELLNCEQGISPWEDTSSVRLKIFGNSTRRAKWDARLGFHGNGAMLTHLSSVKPEGGKISHLRVLVTRVYPTLYIEKFPDGSTLTRSERLENIHQMKCETERQIQLEKLYEEVEKLSDQESQDSEGQYSDDRGQLESGSQISRLMKRCRDHDEFRANLTNSQAYLLQQHTIKQKEKLLQDMQKKFLDLVKKRGLDVGRNVVPLMKIRVAEVENEKISKAMITIWKPNESLQEMVTEGTWIDLYNIVPTSIRYSEVQISAGRQTIFSRSKLKETDKLKTFTQTLKRQCYSIKDLQNPTMNTDYNEIDTFGLIFLVEPQTKEFELTKQPFQNIYLTDADKNIICVNFWGGVKKFGFQSILDTGQVVTCMNLQKRAGNTRKNIPQYRATEFSYITKTSKNATIRKMADDLIAKFCSLDKREFMDDCVALKNNFLNFKYGNIENISPYRLNTSDYNVYKNKVFIDSPLVNKCTDVNLNLTGLDFESTFKQSDTQELSPKTLLRKKKVNEKIAILKRYGEPPPLNPIHLINKSNNTVKHFKSPLTTNDVSPSVASSKDLPPNKVCATSEALPQNSVYHKFDSSPVLNFNRTYVKRVGINPVKLNFCNVTEKLDNNIIDPFAEDFESPPLSLDVNFL